MATRGVSGGDGDGGKPAPYPEQMEFMGRDKRFYGFVSGTGAGKTFAGVYRLWLNATAWNPDSMGAIIVPDKSQFTDNIKPIMEEFGLLDTWDYNSVYTDEPGLVTGNGQRILILSADNQRQIGRIKGKNLGFWWMDEEAEIPPRAREIAEQRLRVGRYPNGFITTTPDGYNHTFDFFVADVDAREDATSTDYGTLYIADDRLSVVGVPPEANPAIRDADIANMRASLPDALVAQEIEGQFVEIGAGVYQRDSFTFVDRGDINPSYDLEYILGVDPATVADSGRARQSDSDYWAATLCALHRNGGTLYAVDTKRERGLTLTEGAEWVAAIAQEAGAKVLVESNQAQRWLAQELADYNLNVSQVQTTQNKEDKLIGMSIPIENGVVQFVNHEVDSQLGYDPRWQDLIQEALSFPEGDHDDLLDSLNLVVDSVDIGTADVLTTDMYGREGDE